MVPDLLTSDKDRSVCPWPRKTYVLVGTDTTSNPYNGDTSTGEANSLLCIALMGLAKPGGLLPAQYVTDGGALRNSWSGGKLFVVPAVEGTQLQTEAIADDLCYNYGKMTFGLIGARMAEFHDGDNDEGWAGWAFWGEAVRQPFKGEHTFDGRLWVKISDQSSNPWSTSLKREVMALTFVKIAQQRGPCIHYDIDDDTAK